MRINYWSHFSVTTLKKLQICFHPMYMYVIFPHFSSKQMDLYDETFRSTVDAVLEGYNGKKIIV